MRKTEEKEVIKKELDKVTTGRICDFCGKAILPVDGEKYDYFYITTSHCDWGNDSIDSFNYFDACSVKCALGLAEKYLKSTNGFRNTGEIDIRHANWLEDGSNLDYKTEIEY